MRHLICLFLITLVSCKTSKNVAVDNTSNVDSVATSAQYRTISFVDSTLNNSTFGFDTLTIDIDRPAESIRFRAVKGRLSSGRKEVRAAVDGYGRLDSVAYKNSASNHSVDKSVTTSVYTPPNGTIVCIASVLAVGGLLYFLLKR